MLDHERHDALHLGFGALDGAGHRVGRARAALDVVDAEAAAAEVRAGPGKRDELAAVERVVDELGEVLAAGAVAAGQRRDGEQLGEALEDARVVERLGDGASSSAGIVLGGNPAAMRNGVGFCVTGSPKTTTWRARRSAGTASARLSAAASAMITTSNARSSGICGTSYGDASHTGASARSSVGATATRSAGRRAAVLERALQGGGLGGLVDDPDAPLGRELGGEQRTGCRGMRLVDEAEVPLEPVDDGGVGPEERAVAAQQVLEGGLPPRVLELRADRVLGHVPHRQLGQERLESERGELGAQRRPLDEVVEHVGVGREARQRAHQLRDRKRGQPVGAGAADDRVEFAELGVDALPRDVHVGEAERHGGDHTGVDEALPLGALLLHAQERLVHVGDVHAGPHVLAREAAQAPALRAGQRRGVAARAVRLDELAERTLEDGRAEAVERVADALQEPEVHAELGDRVERPHAGLRDELVAALEQVRHVLAVELAGQRVGGAGRARRGERDAVPGRVVGAEAELAEPGRRGERGGGLRARGCEAWRARRGRTGPRRSAPACGSRARRGGGARRARRRRATGCRAVTAAR